MYVSYIIKQSVMDIAADTRRSNGGVATLLRMGRRVSVRRKTLKLTHASGDMLRAKQRLWPGLIFSFFFFACVCACMNVVERRHAH